jgi:Rod binding domain-containing protein
MNLPITTPISTSAGTPKAEPPIQQSSKLKSVCQDFESIFFGLMLKEMRKTVPEDTLLGDDAHAQEMFQGMMDDSVAKEMAAHGGSDSLATEMYRQLAGAQASVDANAQESIK